MHLQFQKIFKDEIVILGRNWYRGVNDEDIGKMRSS